MFYEQAIATLNSNRSQGWLSVASYLQMSVDELRVHLEREDLTFEQCIELTKASVSPDLLTYVLGLFDENFGFRGQMKKSGVGMMTSSQRMN